jgi:DNA-binding NarL/FixJ family response regulator
MSERSIHIFIADDHAIVREGIKQILSKDKLMVVAGEAEKGQDLLNALRKVSCDVVLLDISMPDRSGMEILKQLKAEKPGLPVIMLSVHPEDQYAVRCIKAGASAYITKSANPDILLKAIRKVSEGGRYISESLAEKLADAITRDSADKPHELLSDREFEIFRMIASGKTVSEISRDLFLGVSTISTYRSRILEKMNLRNNSELINYAIKNNLL